MVEFFLPTLYISASPGQLYVKVTVYSDKFLMSEIFDMKLTYYDNKEKDLKGRGKKERKKEKKRLKRKEVREDLDLGLYVISETALGLMMPLAESVKLILCLTGINVSLGALSCIFSQ